MKPITIDEFYEYRMVNIVRKFLKENLKDADEFKDGNELEEYLGDDGSAWGATVLDDIQEYMGFDDLLRQVKGE